ncbi:hypothetical protein [Oceanobacillus iheyensis HTE831]|uniref:Uncharacterized protein n=1 Tax=Oceanobacillus iheyensis (strain DSM 14371 / CIP 107618 / JCM 11309 / KCTC 3954 / HTE831) TaxID=221109 RepID=Q8EL89_OCEIH|nr:hypothetical protein [Oceanobacillus iheyensis HTE831]
MKVARFFVFGKIDHPPRRIIEVFGVLMQEMFLGDLFKF